MWGKGFKLCPAVLVIGQGGITIFYLIPVVGSYLSFERQDLCGYLCAIFDADERTHFFDVNQEGGADFGELFFAVVRLIGQR